MCRSVAGEVPEGREVSPANVAGTPISTRPGPKAQPKATRSTMPGIDALGKMPSGLGDKATWAKSTVIAP